MLLRPFGHAPDDKLPAEDLWTYQAVGKKGEELTGYPAISIWHEFQYYPGEFISGAFDWIYEHLGMYIWTIEIWNPKKEAGIDNKEWIHWFRDHPIEDDLKVFEWAQRIAPADSANPGTSTGRRSIIRSWARSKSAAGTAWRCSRIRRRRCARKRSRASRSGCCGRR